jgi:hypothetical protein
MHKGKQGSRPDKQTNPKPTEERLITTDHPDEQPDSKANGDNKKRQHDSRHERDSPPGSSEHDTENRRREGKEISSQRTEAHDCTAQEEERQRKKTHRTTREATMTKQRKDRPEKDPRPKGAKRAPEALHAAP